MNAPVMLDRLIAMKQAAQERLSTEMGELSRHIARVEEESHRIEAGMAAEKTAPVLDHAMRLAWMARQRARMADIGQQLVGLRHQRATLHFRLVRAQAELDGLNGLAARAAQMEARAAERKAQAASDDRAVAAHWRKSHGEKTGRRPA